ncbi:hypothetical protein [Marinoscillum sp. MHG1-6]|uniref:hypothetical protein n=1 Tax=Marinoscillum sp. MHG1-6 TaxID=2959627 RepID=UPI002157AF8D|nr:hypothetical protein [Marinoscillum sp. MHG1-6]
MRNLTFLFLILSHLSATSQLVDKSEFDRLVIADEYNNNYNVIYGRVYKLNLHDSLPNLTLTSEYKYPDTLHRIYQGRIPNWDDIQNRTPNKPLGSISPHLIDSLIETINHPKGLNSLLDFFRIDSIWHSSNKERLIQEWLSSNEQNDKIKQEYAKYVLNDFQQFEQMAFYHVIQSNSSGYSGVTVAFENDIDTLIIQSNGQESFLIPFMSDTTYKNYDPNLSALISEFLPDDIIINKRSLNPSIRDFEQGILTELTFKVNFVDRKKFKKYLSKSR